MKTELLILATILISFSSFSQNLSVEYDYNTHTYSYLYNGVSTTDKPKCILADETIVFRIVNINRLIMDIGFKKTVNTFNVDPPTIPSIGSVPLFPAAVEVSEKNVGDTLPSASESFVEALGQVKSDVSSLNTLMIQLEDWELTAGDIANISATISSLDLSMFNSHLDRLDRAYYDFIIIAPPADNFTKEIMRIKKDLDSKDLRTKYVDLFKLINNITNANTFEYNSPLVQASGDEVVFDLNLDPKESKKALPISSEKLNLNINVLRRFKYSFSTGLFYSDIVEQGYVSQPNLVTNPTTQTDTVSSFTLIKESQPSGTLGVAGFFHFTYQPTCCFGFGINVGSGVDLEEKVQYLTGLTIAFGCKQRLLINTGASWARVSELSNAFTEGSVTAQPLEFTTVKKMERGFYFSLSYNLTK